jgi:hypothetical protein
MKVFIAHAHEDKDAVARPLAEALRQAGFDVWYDEYSLILGDSLSKEIDRGLTECDYGVVILSNTFFAKEWPQKELAGLVARETGTAAPRKLVLPVWHDISADEVKHYSPTLADRRAISTSAGLPAIVQEIRRVVEVTTFDPNRPETAGQRAVHRNPRDMLSRIVPAGPIQPDGGLSPEAIQYVKDFIDEWERSGRLAVMARLEAMTHERRKVLLHEEKYVFLHASHGMFKVWFEVVDLSYMTIGMVRSARSTHDLDYNRALEFFMSQMGLGENDMIKARVQPIVNVPDTVWLEFP